jgi:hypothetical protein
MQLNILVSLIAFGKNFKLINNQNNRGKSMHDTNKIMK